MDTSEDYINMCREAKKEIQDVYWIPIFGDFVHHLIRDFSDYDTYILAKSKGSEEGIWMEFFNKNSEMCGYWHEFKDKLIWLPRQDQLQDIWFQFKTDNGYNGRPLFQFVFNKFFDFYSNLSFFLTYSNWKFYKYNSGEELWLSFIMYEMYKKIWDGKTWIKEEN